ncbi:extracellular triacylglycerol lipase precursor [Russula aff. rugulosa BPL654]|nr:extracellular triacylglycerol lipase precursor [Russula aff. rugulosa BPL654]
MLSIVYAIAVSIWGALHSWHDGQPRLNLRGTTLTGKRLQPSNLDFFGGIPFAEPPVGKYRLSPPRPKHSLSPLRSFNASNYGPECLQQGSDADMSEDCLTLNIFRPSGTDKDSSLPVMFWIYGGGFNRGASSLYDGTFFVEQSVARGTPIVFVSMNYRLGPLGFPQGPEAIQRGALNLGLHDQWAALEWVQKNIASFGGDPHKVTVFGESAGALSASFHYLNENFSTVARAAIFQSGTASSIPVFDGYRATPSWNLFAKNTRSCATASPNNTFPCLISADSSDIRAGLDAAFAIELFPFRPVLDGPGGIVSDHPARRLSHGAGGQVPVMAGTVLDEGTMFLPKNFRAEDIEVWLNANYTPSPLGPGALTSGLDKVTSLYPDDPSAGSPFNTGNETFGTGSGYKRGAAILGDMMFQAPRRHWSQTTSAPSYAYIFTEPQPSNDPALGVSHASELYYIFGQSQTPRLSLAMLDYWISFAVSLTPNDGKGTNRPHWGEYKETEQLLELNSNAMGMIPDSYRASSIDLIGNMSDLLSG